MKQFKYVLAVVLMLCLTLCLFGCGSGESSNNQSSDTNSQESESKQDESSKQEESESSADDGKVTYKVTVMDEEKNPVAGAMVQLCKDNCFPMLTNAEGVAEFRQVEDEYKVSFAVMPAGYEHTGDETEFYFEDGSYEMTITIKKTSTEE